VHTTFTPEQIRWAFSESESFGNHAHFSDFAPVRKISGVL
jgi:hypothetical protein